MPNRGDNVMTTRLSRRAAVAAAAATFALGPVAARAADPLATATITPLGGRVTGKKKKGPWRIGFSNGFSGNSWRAMCVAALQQEAAAHKAQIAELIIVDGQGDITKQVNDIEGLANQQVDAILCIANSGSAVANVLREATRDGIVTVPFNLPVDGEAWSAFTGTDPVTKGRALAAWLVKALAGKGRIVALGGLPGNSYTAACWAGAGEAFKGTGIEVLAMKDAYWEEDRAKVVMADLIAAYPQIDGIWCDGAQDAAGACKALLAANRPLVPVTGDDYNGLLKLYVAEKATQPNFRFAEMSEPTWESVIALRTALTLLGGGDVPKRQIIRPGFITAENYQTYIRPDLPDGVYVDTNLDDAVLRRIFG
jgi:ribose transport system substrate-binding protein